MCESELFLLPERATFEKELGIALCMFFNIFPKWYTHTRDCIILAIHALISDGRVTLCSGSASIPRRVKASWSSDRANISTSTIPQIAKKSPIVRHIGAGGNLTSPSLYVLFVIVVLVRDI